MSEKRRKASASVVDRPKKKQRTTSIVNVEHIKGSDVVRPIIGKYRLCQIENLLTGSQQALPACPSLEKSAFAPTPRKLLKAHKCLYTPLITLP